jgi:hypothetical protein
MKSKWRAAADDQEREQKRALHGRKPISGALARDFRPLALRARDHTAKGLQALVGTLDDPAATPAAKVSPAIALLDRGWGKPTERHEHVNLNAVAELSDDELRNAIALPRAATAPPNSAGAGSEPPSALASVKVATSSAAWIRDSYVDAANKTERVQERRGRPRGAARRRARRSP